MYDKANIFKIKQIRKQLLANLNMIYPSPIPARSLFNTVIGIYTNYDHQVFEKDISYMKEKGWMLYVDDAFNSASGTPFMQRIIRLTAKGKEVAEGTGSDNALES